MVATDALAGLSQCCVCNRRDENGFETSASCVLFARVAQMPRSDSDPHEKRKRPSVALLAVEDLLRRKVHSNRSEESQQTYHFRNPGITVADTNL
jgi:hypothetical protein